MVFRFGVRSDRYNWLILNKTMIFAKCFPLLSHATLSFMYTATNYLHICCWIFTVSHYIHLKIVWHKNVYLIFFIILSYLSPHLKWMHVVQSLKVSHWLGANLNQPYIVSIPIHCGAIMYKMPIFSKILPTDTHPIAHPWVLSYGIVIVNSKCDLCCTLNTALLFSISMV